MTLEKKPWDKKTWIEGKVRPHLDLISKIKKDNGKVSHGKLWSLKKEIFLYEYIKPYISIIRGQKSYFKRWYYYDPFCGSGLFDIEVASQIVKFPGSPLLTYSRNSNYPFTDYYLADASKKNLLTLKQRMDIIFPNNQLHFHTQKFSDSIQFFDTLDANEDAVLAIIDPPGFAQIPWDDIKHVLEFPAVDCFITIITSGIHRNIEQNDSYDTLTRFFGNEDWTTLDDGENIVDAYISKIKEHTGKHVERIGIHMENQKLYDILYISRNPTAISILKDIAGKLEQITLNDLTSIIAETSDVKTLFDY